MESKGAAESHGLTSPVIRAGAGLATSGLGSLPTADEEGLDRFSLKRWSQQGAWQVQGADSGSPVVSLLALGVCKQRWGVGETCPLCEGR